LSETNTIGFKDTVAGRRVVISSDGGRILLRESKRGLKTKKGRQRYTGAWREPKVLGIVSSPLFFEEIGLTI